MFGVGASKRLKIKMLGATKHHSTHARLWPFKGVQTERIYKRGIKLKTGIQRETCEARNSGSDPPPRERGAEAANQKRPEAGRV